MKNLLLLAALIFATVCVAQNPHGHCGVSTAEGIEMLPRLQENLQVAAQGMVEDRGVVNYIPIHFHRVGSATGTGQINIRRILDQLCLLNEKYAPYEVQFYLSPHPLNGLFNSTINNDNVYTNQTNYLLMNSKRHGNALNVYISDVAASTNNQPGLTLAYYSGQRDWIVTRKDQVGYDNGTLQHEIGHFFSLPHTFLGWESGGFDNTFATWPIAPAVSPGGTATERVNGTNATTAADNIADTPPDYNVGFSNNGCSPYVGGAKDPNGELIDPMENNTMSYFSNCDEYIFTPQQTAAIKADIIHPSRNYLDNSFSPSTTEVVTPDNILITPTAESVAANYDNITFTWNEVPGATYYLLEADLLQGFGSTKLQTAVVQNATTFTMTGLDANKNYFWRVRPFNVYDACAAFSASIKFNTGTTSGTNEVKSIKDWQIAPNPASAAQNQVDIYIDALHTADVQIQITDVAGKLIHLQSGLSLTIGENTLSIPVSQISAGMYFLSIKSGTEIATKRLVIE